jgi:quercetin dioxygenase-like cupin family protein
MSTEATTSLRDEAAALPEAWRSRVLATIGGADLKVLRLDGAPYPEEVHAYPEALLVIDGELRLVVEGEARTVRGGELCVIAAGQRHTVAPGSHGTLVIIEPQPTR